MLDCFVIKKSVVPLSISPVSKNQAEQAGIVMMLVLKDLPKKKGSGGARWMIQSSRSNRVPQDNLSNEKVAQKKKNVNLPSMTQ